MKKTLLVLAGLLLLALVGWRVKTKLARAAGGAGGMKRGAAVAVETRPVRRETVRVVRAFTGTVAPRAQFLVAPKVAGRLEALRVNIGQSVTNGAVIAQLDSEEYAQAIAQARAELEVSRAGAVDFKSALEIAARDHARVSELRKQQVASESELDQADAGYRMAQAKYEVALAWVKQREAALKSAEVRLAYTRIAASWDDDGATRVIGERFVDEGAMLRPNDAIVSVLDVDRVIVAIFAIERDYPLLQVGQRAEIATDAFPARRFSGTVARKAPLLKEASRQARVEIEIDNPERLLAPGMFVRVTIEFAVREQATVVPAGAVVRRNGASGLFLVDVAARLAHFVPVTLGMVDAERAEILAPALTGQVVTLGQHLLEDGAAVNLTVAPPPQGGGKQP